MDFREKILLELGFYKANLYYLYTSFVRYKAGKKMIVRIYYDDDKYWLEDNITSKIVEISLDNIKEYFK